MSVANVGAGFVAWCRCGSRIFATDRLVAESEDRDHSNICPYARKAS